MGRTEESVRAFEAALGLAAGAKDEERVLGVTLALQQPDLLASDVEARSKLERALGSQDGSAAADFLARLLRSDSALQRLALALLAALCMDSRAVAVLLQPCLELLVAATLEATSKPQEADPESTGNSDAWTHSEVSQVLQVLRQGRHYAESWEARSALVAATEKLLAAASLEALVLANAELAEAALLLLQELITSDQAQATDVPGTFRTFILSCCLKTELRGCAARGLALGLLAEQLQSSSSWTLGPEKLDEVLGEALLGGEGTRLAALHLARATISRFGLSFGKASKTPLLQRLKPLLSLMAGELRLGLEGHATTDSICAACAALEATIIAFGEEASALEASGNMEDVSDCLLQLHRAVHDVHNWCSDLLQEQVPNVSYRANGTPKELPMLARVAAAFQQEDGRQFMTEYSRSLAVFARLPVAEFAVLLPSVHDLQDWHLTPALGAVFQVALQALDPEAGVDDPIATWRQAALMLTEAALDAAVYMPDSGVPEVPTLPQEAVGNSSSSRPQKKAKPIPEGLAATGLPLPQGTLNQIQKPVPAADPGQEGVVRLCRWSELLWHQVAPRVTSDDLLGELAVLCAALLVSVPAAAAVAIDLREVWANVAAVLFAGDVADGATWRLALRLSGSVMDRHRGFPLALAGLAASSSSSSSAPVLKPPPGGLPGEGPQSDEQDDEWAEGDLAAYRALQDFLRGLQKGGILDTFRSAASMAEKTTDKAPSPSAKPSTSAETAATTTTTKAAITPTASPNTNASTATVTATTADCLDGMD